MNSKRAKAASKRARPAVAQKKHVEYVRPWLLAALVAVCVARPLLPSEGASWLGDDLPFAMLLLTTAAGYLLWAAIRGGMARSLDIVDCLVAVLVATCAASALVGASEGTPRYSINMLWAWVGQGVVFFLTRQLVRSAREARAIVAVMFALAVVLSVFGFYQVLVSLPADRAAYAADPESVMQRSLGQAFPAGSPERLRFEDRLQSTEPLATFALANSLAGFLASWLVVALGVGWNMLDKHRSPDALAPEEINRFGPPPIVRAGFKTVGDCPNFAKSSQQNGTVPLFETSFETSTRTIAFAVGIVTVAGCLLLTKSRSAYLAVAVGLALIPWCSRAHSGKIAWKFALACCAVLVVMIGAGVATGRLDAQVLTEAYKSLGFRLQYWQATLAMIAHYPWFGVGPGNFQDYYTQFKLPQASEEIRDPHNFLLEVWATGGTFAVLALWGTLGAFAWRMWHAVGPAPSWDVADPSDEGSARNVGLVFAGGAAGIALAFLIGPLFGYVLTEGQVACGLLVGCAVGAIFWPWVVRGSFAPRLAALGVLVLAVHWLAAGGIAFPGVAGSFWILLALALDETEPAANPAGRQRVTARLIAVVGLGLTCTAAGACYYTAYQPVVRLQEAMSQAEGVSLPQARLVAYLDAARIDPLSADPWMAIASLEMQMLKQNRPSSQAYRHFVDATNSVRDLRPRSSATCRQIGNWYFEIYERNHAQDAANAALEFLRGAVELYPSSAVLRAELSRALQAVGQTDPATRHAERALELDRQMPHADKKLPEETRERLKTLVERSR
jgi:hypothetical protein